jgi:hypothetical protein
VFFYAQVGSLHLEKFLERRIAMAKATGDKVELKQVCHPCIVHSCPNVRHSLTDGLFTRRQ